jgi:hypothetical protein
MTPVRLRSGTAKPEAAQKATLPVRCKKQTLRPVIQRILMLSTGVAALCLPAAERVQSGMLVAYDFASAEGAVVKDRSGVVPALDLRIDRPGNVRRQAGSVEIRNTAAIRSDKPPTKILNAVNRSNALTVEVWFQPTNLTQEGPARLFTISGDTSNRNLTLGQEGPALQARLRTTRTSNNGMPAIETGRLLKTALTHAVYTRDTAGKARLFVNGRLAKEQSTPGTISNWNGNYRLALGNEFSGDRAWRGTLHWVAVYGRSLSAAEVSQNFKAGATARVDPAAQRIAANETLFETRIAPLLSKHCLECHDPATAKGDLDLSRKLTAFAEPDMIVAGQPAKSLVWESVVKNEMPKKRPPLSAAEKALLQQWIEGGARWTLARIDPAVYAHGEQAGVNWIRRLTVAEYISTVRAATGVDIAKDARALLPTDLRADGFSNTAYNLNVDLKHINAYAQLADRIVARMDVKPFARRFGGNGSFTDNKMRAFIERLGRWMLRGPLEEREVDLFRGITTSLVANGGTYEEAVGLVLEAMLQSPRFIYRMENQQAGGRISDAELAVRLSFLLWGAPPDEALNAAADKGQLGNASQLRPQVERMLKDPRAMERSVQFASEWLNLGYLANLRPDKQHFPNWNPALAGDMHTETIAFFKEIVWKQNRPLPDLLNAQFTHLTPRLAKHYGLPAIAEGEGSQRYDLTKVPARGGLLTQGSILTRGGDDASMVTRGLFVMHDLLRGVVKDPPPCVDTTPVASQPGLSQRSIAEKRIANANCGGCHSKFEPLAFGLERFDGLGSYFEKDNHGNRLREDGKILFPGAAKPIVYRTSGELMNHLAASDRVRQSITWKLTQYALGRPLGARDARAVQAIHEAGWQKAGTYANLITAIALSDLFQTQPTEENP